MLGRGETLGRAPSTDAYRFAGGAPGWWKAYAGCTALGWKPSGTGFETLAVGSCSVARGGRPASKAGSRGFNSPTGLDAFGPSIGIEPMSSDLRDRCTAIMCCEGRTCRPSARWCGAQARGVPVAVRRVMVIILALCCSSPRPDSNRRNRALGVRCSVH